MGPKRPGFQVSWPDPSAHNLNTELESLRARVAAAELARAEAARMLATASHDLTQPLSAARLYLSTLAAARLRPQNRNLLNRADCALASAETMLGSLLELSSIDAGGIKPEITSFPISSLLLTLANEFEPLAAGKGLSLTVVMSTTRVQSDIRLLRRIIQNLISNAVRHTAKGRVVVGCRRTPIGLRIEVWDTGPGIPDEKLGVIFEEYTRLNNGAASQGMGLGLSIVQRLARVLEHDVAVRTKPGIGSMFAVTVGYGRAMPALKPADLARRADQRALAGKCVTVIENDEQVRDALCSLLRNWRCHPLPTDSSDGAIQVHRTLGRSPDVVIADFYLGNAEDGLQAIALLRRVYGAELPALLISADAHQDLRRSARQQKCGMMLKPIKPPELRVMMEKLVA